MKMIIDIPKDIIESAKSNPNYYPTYHFEKIWRAIANGKLLPKGHGRLIDADKFAKYFMVDTANQTYRFGTIKKQIEKAPTIIEADKAESEGRHEI